MYSDKNFEIRPEYADRVPAPHIPINYEANGVNEEVGQVILGFFISVVIVLAALFVAATLGVLPPQPQPLTHKECATCQFSESPKKSPESREMKSFSLSPRTPINPQPNPSARSSPSSSGTGNEEVGASAPSFQWICGGSGVYCHLYSNGVALQGFLLTGATVKSSAVSPNLPTPVDWGCVSISETELYCTLQRDGRVFGFTYDGVKIKEFK
jgi:hypothetical protein